MNTHLYGNCLLFLFAFMSALFVLAQLLRNNSIVDIFWGPGFILLAAFTRISIKMPFHTAAVLIDACLLIWGIRLSSYIFIRNFGQGEDWRYVNFRKAWGKHPMLGAYFQVFLLQGLLMFIISLPVIRANSTFIPVSAFSYAGFLLWLTGFLFEAIGDYQLRKFKLQPENKGRTMRYGLWRYTRHPNYFGEILIWWGIWIMCINFFSPLQTLVSLLSPLTISWLLSRVSGVPMLEKKYKDKPEYLDYIRNTPALFPKFLK